MESLELSSLFEDAKVVICAAFLQGSSHRNKVCVETHHYTYSHYISGVIKIVTFEKSSKVEFCIRLN